MNAPFPEMTPAAPPSPPLRVLPPLRLLIPAPRGFCAGVDRAIEIVERAIAKYGAPVYVRHEIVHNRFVVEGLKAKGKQVDYLVFENEGHDVLKHENRVTCYNAITDFFKEHLRP